MGGDGIGVIPKAPVLPSARDHAQFCVCGGVCCCVLHARRDFVRRAAMPLPPMCVCSLCVLCVYRDKIDEACKHHCSKAMKELEACTARVEAKFAAAKPGDEITANCTGQYFDFWHCIDHCVSTLIKITCALYWCVFMHV
jgi:ubiquinol-cytochrome c reductase subunit 6